MRADKVLRSIIERDGLTMSRISASLGRSKLYLNALLGRGSIPKTDTMAGICDAMGYDLIARSREDGYEFYIDPPE